LRIVTRSCVDLVKLIRNLRMAQQTMSYSVNNRVRARTHPAKIKMNSMEG
jgi:hypothetical protein